MNENDMLPNFKSMKKVDAQNNEEALTGNKLTATKTGKAYCLRCKDLIRGLKIQYCLMVSF